MEKSVGSDIYKTTSRILNLIASNLETSSSKAYLANLRQSINKGVHMSAGVFPLIFGNIPDEYLGRHGKLTAGEEAIILSLQLYALHQQGKNQNVNSKCDESKFGNIGASLNSLRGDDSQASDRRFNAMITATSFTELSNHLRHLIKLLKSKTSASVDYAKLAQDLFWFQKNRTSNIRLEWARAYYRTYKNEDGGNENDE